MWGWRLLFASTGRCRATTVPSQIKRPPTPDFLPYGIGFYWISSLCVRDARYACFRSFIINIMNVCTLHDNCRSNNTGRKINKTGRGIPGKVKSYPRLYGRRTIRAISAGHVHAPHQWTVSTAMPFRVWKNRNAYVLESIKRCRQVIGISFDFIPPTIDLWQFRVRSKSQIGL